VWNDRAYKRVFSGWQVSRLYLAKTVAKAVSKTVPKKQARRFARVLDGQK